MTAMSNSSNSNPITKRIAVKILCEFASPALISSGYGENTDSDIIRYADECCFVPGSTIAGVLRSLCPQTAELFGVQVSTQVNTNVNSIVNAPEDSQDSLRNANKDDIMDDLSDRLSPLWVYDAEVQDAKVIELDGVSLDVINKVALDGKKYDYEAISPGAIFTIRLLLTIRKNDNETKFEQMLKELLGAVKTGKVAFGARTHRGFGLVKHISTNKCEFDLAEGNRDNLIDWINFDWYKDDKWVPADSTDFYGDNSTIIAKVRLQGSVMIRDTRNIYEGLGINEKAPDYKHLSIGGKPVILGTSWAGVFRSGLSKVLGTLYPEQIGTYIDDVFGFVNEESETAGVSKITFSSSFIDAYEPNTEGYRSITRVKIDRFTGGASDGALFTEKPWYGGETSLEISYPKDREDIRELIILGLEGFNTGVMQIGGETSIGRGFLNVLTIDGENAADVLGTPKHALIDKLKEAGEIG